MRTAALALAALLVGAAPAAAQAQARQAGSAPTLSKFESRRLPPDLVKRRIAEQLADLLVMPSERPAPGNPTRPLDELWYRTTPRATDVPGVCQSDTVTFGFRPVGEAPRPGDVPTRVIGLETTTGYRLLGPATARAAFAKARADEQEDREPQGYPDDAACARLSTKEGVFTKANSAWQYLEALSLLEETQAAVREGKPLDVACDQPYNAAEACRAEIIAFDPTLVGGVYPCENVTPPKGQQCLRLDDWVAGLDIYTQFVGGRWVAVRVHIPEPGIIIADSRRD